MVGCSYARTRDFEDLLACCCGHGLADEAKGYDHCVIPSEPDKSTGPQREMLGEYHVVVLRKVGPSESDGLMSCSSAAVQQCLCLCLWCPRPCTFDI